MIVDEMQRSHCVQVPAEDIKEVELAALNGVEAGVGAALGKTSFITRREKEAAIKTVSH